MYRNREELYFDIVCGALDKTTDSSIDSNSKFTGKIQVVSQESHGSNVYCDAYKQTTPLPVKNDSSLGSRAKSSS